MYLHAIACLPGWVGMWYFGQLCWSRKSPLPSTNSLPIYTSWHVADNKNGRYQNHVTNKSVSCQWRTRTDSRIQRMTVNIDQHMEIINVMFVVGWFKEKTLHPLFYFSISLWLKWMPLSSFWSLLFYLLVIKQRHSRLR